MISINSLKNFAIINSTIFLLAFIQYFCSLYHITPIELFVLFVIRNYTLIRFIEYSTKDKPKINNNQLLMPTERYEYEFDIHVFTTTAVETMTHILIKKTFVFSDVNGFYSIVTFIPMSFLFEICFDFFHYFSHRLLHHKYLYKYFHKKHHTFKHPSAIITFYQEPVDLVLTNSLPTIAALYFCHQIVYRFSYFQFHLIIIYKSFVEISGHCGSKMYPTSSFTQCIWLPKALGIELYTENHDLHHSANHCNYAKRFSLWDKIMGTYKCE